MKRWGLWIAGILAIASASAVWKTWRGQLGNLSLAEEIAAAKREGVPLTSRDLQEPEIPPGENAAGPYLLATTNTRTITASGTWRKQFNDLFPPRTPRRMEALSPMERRKLKALFALHGPSISLIREAGRRPKMVLNRRWSLGMSFEDVPGMRDLVSILGTRADLRDLEGDTEGAFADVGVAARAVALLHAAKSPMEGFVRFEGEKLVLDALNRVADRHRRDYRVPKRI